MNRMNKMILICTAVLAAVFLAGFDRELSAAAAPPQRKKVSDNKVEVYPVKTVLRELFSVDPEKRIGVYGRYTELTAEDDVPEALSRIIAEVNARAKETVEAEAERFLAENRYRKRKAGSGAEDHFRYHNVSCIVNVTRADSVLFSILEAEMISGIGEKEGNRVWNMATMTTRSPGSSFKPLAVYTPALEMGIITPDSLIEDSSIRLSDGTLFPSSNDGKKPTGDMVTVEYGVQKSMNTIAVQVLQRVSPQYSFNFVRERFGITTLVEGYTGPSGKYYSDLDLAPLSLGGLTKGVSVYEMAAAYAVFARDGIYTKPYVYTVVTDSNGEVILSTDGYDITFDAAGQPIITGYAAGEAVLKESTVRQMTQMLINAVDNGTGRNARINGVVVAGKTGTTNDDYDRWFAGYTPDYTAVVWTGYEKAESINYDGNPSVDLWHEVMVRLTDN